MLSQIFNDKALPVTDPSVQFAVYEQIVRQLHAKASSIVAGLDRVWLDKLDANARMELALSRIPLRYNEMCGIHSGKTFILEPAKDFPFLFAALKLHGQIISTGVNGTILSVVSPEEQEDMRQVFKMVRDAAKGFLSVEAYQGLQALLKPRYTHEAWRPIMVHTERMQLADVFDKLRAHL